MLPLNENVREESTRDVEYEGNTPQQHRCFPAAHCSILVGGRHATNICSNMSSGNWRAGISNAHILFESTSSLRQVIDKDMETRYFRVDDCELDHRIRQHTQHPMYIIERRVLLTGLNMLVDCEECSDLEALRGYILYFQRKSVIG